MFIILFSIACNYISMKLLFEKIPYIHRKELFSTYTTITHDKCRFGLELISELTKSFRILFGITLHLDGNDCSLLTKNEINLVGKFTPIFTQCEDIDYKWNNKIFSKKNTVLPSDVLYQNLSIKKGTCPFGQVPFHYMRVFLRFPQQQPEQQPNVR